MLINRYKLEIISFCTGAVVMISELTGSRLLAPVVGTSLPVWTSLIGIMLGSLSLGYFLGGKLADKKPDIQVLSLILLSSSITLGMIPLFSIFIFSTLTNIFLDVRINAILATLFLFTLPSILLGSISPYILRLKMHTVKSSGEISGNLSAISTLGSIFGTFFAGFFLIAYVGSMQIFYCVAGLIFFLSVWLFSQHLFKKIIFVGMLLFSFLIIQYLYSHFTHHVIAVKDTWYNHVMVYDSVDTKTKQKVRTMQIGNEYSSAMFLNSPQLVYGYTKYFRLADHFTTPITAALMIGGAGYSYPKDFLHAHPNAKLDVAEIDPEVTELAKKYFQLKPPTRLTILTQDGRTFLNSTKNTYDAIYNDAFTSFYTIPFQMTTKEAVEKMYHVLNPNGVVITNLISSIRGKKSLFYDAEYATYKSVFPQVFSFAVGNVHKKDQIQNIILIAVKSPVPQTFTDTQNELNGFLKQQVIPSVSLGFILTDNYAPVETYATRLF